MLQWSQPSYRMHSLRQPERSRRFMFAGDVPIKRFQPTRPLVTALAGARPAPVPLAGEAHISYTGGLSWSSHRE